jgi:hypothetical protein
MKLKLCCLIVILIFIILCTRENFSNCGPSAPNVKPPDWFIPQDLNLKYWKTHMNNVPIESSAYRFWQY